MIIILTLILVSKLTTLANLPSNNNSINLKDSSPNTSCFVKTIRSKRFESLSSRIPILSKKGLWMKYSCQWTLCKHQKNMLWKQCDLGFEIAQTDFFEYKNILLKICSIILKVAPNFGKRILLFLQHTARNIFHTFKRKINQYHHSLTCDWSYVCFVKLWRSKAFSFIEIFASFATFPAVWKHSSGSLNWIDFSSYKIIV